MYVNKPGGLLVHCELISGKKVWLEISCLIIRRNFGPSADLLGNVFLFNSYSFAGEAVLTLDEPVRIYTRIEKTSELAMGETPEDPYYLEFDP